MNATKFAVFLVIGVLCAIVTARPVEEISNDTKLGISSATNKATTTGIGAELGQVTASIGSSSGGFGIAAVTVLCRNGPNTASSSGSGSTVTGGFVNATGPSVAADSNSGSNARGVSGAAAGPGVASSGGSGSANSGSNTGGRTSG